jgi:hypothetical protein
MLCVSQVATPRKVARDSLLDNYNAASIAAYFVLRLSLGLVARLHICWGWPERRLNKYELVRTFGRRVKFMPSDSTSAKQYRLMVAICIRAFSQIPSAFPDD